MAQVESKKAMSSRVLNQLTTHNSLHLTKLVFVLPDNGFLKDHSYDYIQSNYLLA